MEQQDCKIFRELKDSNTMVMTKHKIYGLNICANSKARKWN